MIYFCPNCEHFMTEDDLEEERFCYEDEYGLSENASEDDCWDTYYEVRESWIDYWVEEAKDENDIDKDYQ